MSIASNPVDAVTVDELSPAEGQALFDRECQRELGVSGAEFLRVYDSGELPEEWDERAIQRLEFLLPFAR